MSDKAEKAEVLRKMMQPALPRRPSFEKVVEEVDKWANSPGLQKPK
jgi:hypothetical protein